MARDVYDSRGYPGHTAGSQGTVNFVKITPELEACFVVAALQLGTRPMRFRDTLQRARYRNRYALYFQSVMDTLPPLEAWPVRLHGRITGNDGVPLGIWEKLALAYMWWIDEHFRRQAADGSDAGGILRGGGTAAGDGDGS